MKKKYSFIALSICFMIVCVGIEELRVVNNPTHEKGYNVVIENDIITDIELIDDKQGESEKLQLSTDLDIHEHEYRVVNIIDAQIGVSGYKFYSCFCGDSYKEIIEPYPVPTLPPHEHSYTITGVVDAQSGVSGSKTYTCECGENYIETIPALPDPTPEINYGGWHQSDYAFHIFSKINEVRVNSGLFELPWNDGDTWLADVRAEELVNEVATNTVHSGIKKYDRYVGEIAACGYDPGYVVDAWMQSSGHANQILADYNTSMAVGVYYDEYTASNYYIVIFR